MGAKKVQEGKKKIKRVSGEKPGEVMAKVEAEVARLKLELYAGKLKDVRGVRKARKKLARLKTRGREEELRQNG